MATDAKPASAHEDPPADDLMDADAEEHEEAEEQEEEGDGEQDEGEEPKKKRGRRKRVPRPPATPSSDRPSRERKTVERYAELTPRSTPAKKNAPILQGSGTKLKEIPNVGLTLAMTAAGAEAGGEKKAEVLLVRDDAPKLLAALKEMKDGLDLVRTKVESLTRKVRKNQLPMAEGIGYLEAKHHLLLSYCQDLVYYLLRKAKGNSVDGHPVVRSLVEIRLFLEKIRPIDKKMEYQIQKLTNAADGAAAQDKAPDAGENGRSEQKGDEDLLNLKPNPDMMDLKFPHGQGNGGIYVPPKFEPTTDKRSKEASRKDKALVRMATDNPYLKEMIDDAADRPEEWKETAGDESKEFTAYMRQREKQEKAEEELFTRAPVTKREKYMEKQMKKQLHGLQGLTDGFDLGMNMLLDGEKEDDDGSGEPRSMSAGRRKHQKGGKKRKRH